MRFDAINPEFSIWMSLCGIDDLLDRYRTKRIATRALHELECTFLKWNNSKRERGGVEQ